MGAPIRNITIVGGGTAGWLVAAFINHRLQWGAGHPDGFTITLIEAPGIPTIGVGEATIPGLRQTLAMLEIDENEFVARTDATFKLGVRFDGWNDPAGPRPPSYFHPFSGGLQIAGRNPAASLLAYGVPEALGLDPQIGNLVGDAVAAAEAGKAPRTAEDRSYNGALSYAYHLDAGKFAAFLREVATARGVRHVRDKVIDVERTEQGLIGALNLDQGGRFPVELVIDCSGFRGLLINGVMDEPFESYADYLPNDRAVAIQIAHDPAIRRPTATVSTALDYGWRWEIGLQSRVGTGHVYCSSFLEPGAAADALLASMPGAQPIAGPNFVTMRTGRCRRSWVGNCVAIGLSSGFLEPLESTAIQFIDYACRRLLQCLPSTDYEPAPIAKFNRQIADLYEDIRDFVCLHFVLNDRNDNDYWRMCRNELKRSDRLAECLDFWRHGLPDPFDPRSTDVFTSWSVNCLLLGKGFYPSAPIIGSDLLPREYWERYLGHLHNFRPVRLARMQDQAAVLEAMNAAAQHGASASATPRPRSAPMMGHALGHSLPVMTPALSMADL